ncbi:MAG TPA: hypothetical protein VFV34_11895 [Blastocatellia bacterium]|nr:hypothetical protein [Blastocatellia bacterium]
MLNRDFREFVQSLNDHDVRYLVVGGYAVAFHGHPRYTKDLDVWIEPTESNSTKMMAALKQFGFASLDLSAEDFLNPSQVIQLGYPPNRIDILMRLEGVDFEVCYSVREELEIEGTRVLFIDLANLRKNKSAVGRHQDLADLENLNES